MPSNCSSTSLCRPRDYANARLKSPQMVARGTFLDGLEEGMAPVTSVPSVDLQPGWEKQRPLLTASSSLAVGRGRSPTWDWVVGPGALGYTPHPCWYGCCYADCMQIGSI